MPLLFLTATLALACSCGQSQVEPKPEPRPVYGLQSEPGPFIGDSEIRMLGPGDECAWDNDKKLIVTTRSHYALHESIERVVIEFLPQGQFMVGVSRVNKEDGTGTEGITEQIEGRAWVGSCACPSGVSDGSKDIDLEYVGVLSGSTSPSRRRIHVPAARLKQD